jgi:glutathione S-transferase
LLVIKLYHAPVSPNSRRVWITLIEKGLEFELQEVALTGEQFQPNFLAISPFHHIPALVDDGFNLIESLALLDYLEAKYPTPAMLPSNPKDLAIVRMVELVTVNELLPAMTPLTTVLFDLPGDAEQIQLAKEKVPTSFKFLESLLDDRPFFGSENITLAESVAGSVVNWAPRVGIGLEHYPKLSAWCDRLTARPAWQQTQPTPRVMAEFKSLIVARQKQAAK